MIFNEGEAPVGDMPAGEGAAPEAAPAEGGEQTEAPAGE